MGLSTKMGEGISYLVLDKGSCQVSEPEQSLHLRQELIICLLSTLSPRASGSQPLP